jgi:transposase
MLIALLPELGHTNKKTIASICGLAPITKDSGTLSGYRRTAGERPAIKRGLLKGIFLIILCRINKELEG